LGTSEALSTCARPYGSLFDAARLSTGRELFTDSSLMIEKKRDDKDVDRALYHSIGMDVIDVTYALIRSKTAHIRR